MSNPQIEQELTVGEIIKVYASHWRVFVVLTLALFVMGSLIYAVKIPYVATATIVVNDSQNSALQAFSNQYYGLSKSVQESKKGSSLLSKHIEYLKTREFYESLLIKIEQRGQSGKITMEEQQGYEEFKEKFLKPATENSAKKISVLQTLDRWTKAQQDSDFEIKVSVSTPDKAQSLFLSNTVAELAAEKLKERESLEITRVESFMLKQKEDADKKLTTLGKQLADIQNRDDGLMPLAAQGKMGDYVSDLLVRSNEIKLKIAENKKTIDYLDRSRSAQRESALYGVGGKIEALRIENSMLASKLSQVQISLDQLKKQVKQLPFAAAMADDLKKKSELEFGRFKEVSNALSKIEAQKLSIDTRFEVLEVARWESTLPQVGLATIALLSILLSQFFGSLLIYFKYLWNPDIVTAQASRNVMIFDGHSTDPRVIFENSKIKFNLRSPEEDEDEDADLAPYRNAKKIAWNVFKRDKSSDVSH